MKRTTTKRGESVCHSCRQVLADTVKVHTPDLPAGARWQYCPPCATQLAAQQTGATT